MKDRKLRAKASFGKLQTGDKGRNGRNALLFLYVAAYSLTDWLSALLPMFNPAPSPGWSGKATPRLEVSGAGAISTPPVGSPSQANSAACNSRGAASTGNSGRISSSAAAHLRSRNLRALTSTRDSSEPTARL